MQAIYAGRKATLSIGNIKPIGEMPEGAIICNVEEVSYSLCPTSLKCPQSHRTLSTTS
jgi:hypothetical protein